MSHINYIELTIFSYTKDLGNHGSISNQNQAKRCQRPGIATGSVLLEMNEALQVEGYHISGR
ncbi:hypothetical protein J6590_048771 [Homalodisca vitripennis]|nr:hypothetical protein J6590_048771 [Homalodisca vitripennis]